MSVTSSYNIEGKTTTRVIELTGYGGYKFNVAERPITKPRKNHVLVNAKACGINFADILYMQGVASPATTPQAIQQTTLPIVMGCEAAGVVVDVGEGVDRLQKGQRVMCMQDGGLWSEYATVNQDLCYPIPDEMPLDDAASFLINYVTAYHVLFEFGHLRPNKSVLVHMAAGGVGIAATQLCACVPGVVVFGTTSSSKLDAVKKFGVTHPIDYGSRDYVDAIRKLSPQGVDIVLDPLNGADATRGFELLKPLGRIIHYGAANAVSGPGKSYWNMMKTYMNTKNFNPLTMMEENKAMCGYHLTRLMETPEVFVDVVQRLLELYKEKKIRPVIDSVWPFEEVKQAFARLYDRKNVGKVVLLQDAKVAKF